MESLMKSDIFFFITSIAVVIFTILGVIISIYIIKMVRDGKEITGRLKTMAEATQEDFEKLRARINTEGGIISRIAALFMHRKKSEPKTSKGTGKKTA